LEYSKIYNDGDIYCPVTNCITNPSSGSYYGYKSIDRTLGLGLFQSMNFAQYKTYGTLLREISSRLVYFKRAM
jgi:hypothetical protein